MSDETNLYEAMGGRATFEQLVSHFYALVAVDPVLRPMYPDEDFKLQNVYLCSLSNTGAAQRLIASKEVTHD
jgi:truncated hemoglobin YjbI